MRYEFYRVEENVRYPNTENPAWHTLDGWDDHSLEKLSKCLDVASAGGSFGDRQKYRIVKVTVEEINQNESHDE